MTQNKTPLQEALEYYSSPLFQGICQRNGMECEHYEAIEKAAQAYNDLPEKIEEMKKKEVLLGVLISNGDMDDYHAIVSYNQACKDILNLLKEGV